jgi:outer membrane protein assembly factor BamD (BamD/ComL family)
MNDSQRGAPRSMDAAASPRPSPNARSQRAALFFAAALSYAPYQCGKAADRSVREETPGEALYGLAQKMKTEGDEQGYRTTLRYIVERYPSSRYATTAKLDLATDAASVDAP